LLFVVPLLGGCGAPSGVALLGVSNTEPRPAVLGGVVGGNNGRCLFFDSRTWCLGHLRWTWRCSLGLSWLASRHFLLQLCERSQSRFVWLWHGWFG
jgi:hypothetical protein